MPKVITKKTVTQKLGKSDKKTKYLIEMRVNDETFKIKSDNIFTGLKEIEKPTFFKTEVVLTIRGGAKSLMKIYKTFQARRTFGNLTALEILASNLSKELG